MNRSQTLSRLLVILFVFSLMIVFSACEAVSKQESQKDPLVKFQNEVLKQDPDIIDSKLTMNDDTVECTIEVKEAATDDFAKQIAKDHAQQLSKRLPDKTIRMKVMKSGSMIEDFSTDK